MPSASRQPTPTGPEHPNCRTKRRDWAIAPVPSPFCRLRPVGRRHREFPALVSCRPYRGHGACLAAMGDPLYRYPHRSWNWKPSTRSSSWTTSGPPPRRWPTGWVVPRSAAASPKGPPLQSWSDPGGPDRQAVLSSSTAPRGLTSSLGGSWQRRAHRSRRRSEWRLKKRNESTTSHPLRWPS